MLVDAIKGKPAEAAINALKFMPQKSAGMVEKIVRSAAVADAIEHEHRRGRVDCQKFDCRSGTVPKKVQGEGQREEGHAY